MKSGWKKPTIFFAVLVGAYLLVRITLGWLVPAEGIRGLIAEQTIEATGADVKLGTASVRIWPRIAIAIGQGSISGTGPELAARTGTPNAIESYAVELDQLTANLKIGPLLKGRVETGEIVLSCSELVIEEKEDTLRLAELELVLSDLSMPTAGLETTSSEAGSEFDPVPPGESIPEDLSLAFSLTVKRLFWQDVPYDEIALNGELDSRLVLLESFSAKRSTGIVAGSGEVDFQRDPWGILDFESVITEVPSSALLEPWVPELGSRLDCVLSGEVSGGCGLRDQATVNRTLDLNGHLHSGQGVLRAGDWLKDIERYLGERQDLKDIHFTDLQHSFHVTQGRYVVDELTIDGPDTDWTGSGWVGLDGRLDVDLAVKLPAGFTPDLGQLSFLAEGMRDEDQRVNLTLHLSGEAANPKVGLKLGGAKDSGAPNTADALKKGLGGFLDKLKTK